MIKFDYKKDFKQMYFPPQEQFTVVDVPEMNFLMIDGAGDPNNNPQYQEVVNALYSLAYTLKFALKPQGIEYVVPPLEGLWWAENMADFSLQHKENWLWTMMIMQPAPVSPDLFARARQETQRKKGLAALQHARLVPYAEGLAVQITYLGAYADEGPTIARLHTFLHEQGYTFNGKHHEIYLGDPRRTPAEKLKTVIRQPVRHR